MTKNVVVIGTLDTKGEEHKFVKELLEDRGIETTVINTGVKGEPSFEPDVSNEEVAKAGNETLENLIEKGDRGYAMETMGEGAAEIVTDLFSKGKVDGIISMGGSSGTSVSSTAMKALPFGVPKVMVSTMASGQTRPYVGGKDILMLYSVTDVAGLNRVSQKVFSNAVLALAGMVKEEPDLPKTEKKIIGASMFGVTTPCVDKAREYLEDQGYEVLVFHATGSGGKALENLVEEGIIDGVLDVTTSELTDELVGGVLSAGPERLEAASKEGIPQIVIPGAINVVNFGPEDTVPEKFKERTMHVHNPTVTVVRTTEEENKQLGKMIAEKVNKSEGPASVFLPLKGLSLLDEEGEPFHDPEKEEVLFEAIRNNLNDSVRLEEIETDINDPEFATTIAQTLDDMIKQ